ncbi:MAG: hypothetical protein KGI88_04460 [Betaproteobacteria bacterium]|uniref:hypothetical protein n=1 Tax=Ferrovum sp. PN-J185 TaxID=1356306 RepID=UPI0012E9323B|nr:hypothetical protein [Ferrovum sp. PN-J185]MDE2056469.1 hypothetical protein [Betaproteobacteria bacterium]
MKKSKFFLFNKILISVLLGSLWLIKGWGIVFSPFIIIVLKHATKNQRVFLALIYFATGSYGLINAYQRFFHDNHYLLAVLCWLGCSIILAIPWFWYSNTKRLFIILLLEAIPPFGIIGWLSPIHALGFWYPGSGILGLILGIITFIFLDKYYWQGLIVCLTIGCSLNLFTQPPTSPINWQGINTEIKPNVTSLDATEYIIQSLSTLKPVNNTLVIYPETIINNWQLGTRILLEHSLQFDGNILLGVTLQHQDGYEDAIVIVNHGVAEPIPLFFSVLPTPLSMWNPFLTLSYHAHWWPITREIQGVRVNAIICYDQLLVWPWLTLLFTHPQVILTISNEWWSNNSSIPDIQLRCRQAWSRLLGRPIIEARNTLRNN